MGLGTGLVDFVLLDGFGDGWRTGIGEGRSFEAVEEGCRFVAAQEDTSLLGFAYLLNQGESNRFVLVWRDELEVDDYTQHVEFLTQQGMLLLSFLQGKKHFPTIE